MLCDMMIVVPDVAYIRKGMKNNALWRNRWEQVHLSIRRTGNPAPCLIRFTFPSGAWHKPAALSLARWSFNQEGLPVKLLLIVDFPSYNLGWKKLRTMKLNTFLLTFFKNISLTDFH